MIDVTPKTAQEEEVARLLSIQKNRKIKRVSGRSIRFTIRIPLSYVSSQRDEKWQCLLDWLCKRGSYDFRIIDCQVRVVVLNSLDIAEAALQRILDDEPPYLAFDLEANPEDAGRVDLVQMAYGNEIYILHLSPLGMAKSV